MKEKQAVKPVLNLTSSQLGFKTKKPKAPKQPVYYNSIIDGFNAKLQKGITNVKGLNEADENEPQMVPINSLLKRALLDT